MNCELISAIFTFWLAHQQSGGNEKERDKMAKLVINAFFVNVDA